MRLRWFHIPVLLGVGGGGGERRNRKSWFNIKMRTATHSSGLYNVTSNILYKREAHINQRITEPTILPPHQTNHESSSHNLHTASTPPMPATQKSDPSCAPLGRLPRSIHRAGSACSSSHQELLAQNESLRRDFATTFMNRVTDDPEEKTSTSDGHSAHGKRAKNFLFQNIAYILIAFLAMHSP